MNASSNPASQWLLLVTSFPTQNATARMRLWRALKPLGCATLRDGAYLLPAAPAAERALSSLAQDTTAAGGAAHVLRVLADARQEAAFRALFDRGENYRALLDAIGSCPRDEPEGAKMLKALQRDFAAIAATDFFPGAAQAQAATALADLEARLLRGEPHAAHKRLRRLAPADFLGRSWATRQRPWVDRLASAWLIRRFIDRKARFLWLARPENCPKRALGFDFDGASFTHVDSRVTFEVLLASFGLEADKALARIARIVHFLDVGGAPVEEAAGVELLLTGLRRQHDDDDTLLREAARLFDSLYASHMQTPS